MNRSQYYEKLGDTMRGRYAIRTYQEAMLSLLTNSNTYQQDVFRIKQKINRESQKITKKQEIKT